MQRTLHSATGPDMLHIHLLGDLRLTNGSVMVPRLATQKAVSLLGYLIMNAGRAHPREGLAEMLWPQRPRENARRSLHTALWQIRRALKQAGLEPAATPTRAPTPRDTQPPQPPIQLAPVDGVPVDCGRVSLTWKPAADPGGVRDYDVELEKLVDRSYVS